MNELQNIGVLGIKRTLCIIIAGFVISIVLLTIYHASKAFAKMYIKNKQSEDTNE